MHKRNCRAERVESHRADLPSCAMKAVGGCVSRAHVGAYKPASVRARAASALLRLARARGALLHRLPFLGSLSRMQQSASLYPI